MAHLGFTSRGGSPDVCRRPATLKDETQVYEWTLLYVDDCLVVSENAESIMKKEIGRYFELKKESIGPPSLYLGCHLRDVVLDTGVKAWVFGSS